MCFITSQLSRYGLKMQFISINVVIAVTVNLTHYTPSTKYIGVYSFCLCCKYVCLSVCLSVCLYVNLFSVKDFSTTTWVRILKFDTKLDSDEVYCVTKTATYGLSVLLFVHFSFSQVELSVTHFSAPIRASVLKFCVLLQVGNGYCVNGN